MCEVTAVLSYSGSFGQRFIHSLQKWLMDGFGVECAQEQLQIKSPMPPFPFSTSCQWTTVCMCFCRAKSEHRKQTWASLLFIYLTGVLEHYNIIMHIRRINEQFKNTTNSETELLSLSPKPISCFSAGSGDAAQEEIRLKVTWPELSLWVISIQSLYSFKIRV